MRIRLDGLEATAAAARALVEACGPLETITLTGGLGAGKTTFCQYFIGHLLPGGEEVTSPTFTLVHTYERGARRVAHIDCYRLQSPMELEEIGLDELLDTHLCLIEWPEIAAGRLPADRLELTLEREAGSEVRQLTLTPHGNWLSRLPHVQEMLVP